MQWFGCVTDCGLGLVSFVGIFVVVDWGCWYCLRKGSVIVPLSKVCRSYYAFGEINNGGIV